MLNLEVKSNSILRYVGLGALHGAAAWSAYALAEFASSSVLFRLVRPYATFTAWHWQLTALLIAAFLVSGVVLGGIAGLLIGALSSKHGSLDDGETAVRLEGAATLTVIAAFTANILSMPAWPSGKPALLVICVILAALVIATIRSSEWSERLGFLVNPWIVAALLLGVGQGIGFLQLQDLGQQLGAHTWMFMVLLILAVVALVAGSIFGGRRFGASMPRDRFTMFGPGWAALGLVGILILSSLILAARSPEETSNGLALPGSSAQPNVVVLVMDTVRADHLSLYGYGLDTTPNLKQLAQDSVVYNHAMSAADVTLTSHASLFTGLYPTWHGAYCQPPDSTHGRALNPGTPTIAEILAAKGYSTVGVAANLYLRSDFGLQKGFQTFRIPRPVPVLGADESWYLLRIGMRRVMNTIVDTAQFDRLFSRGDDVNQEMYKLLQAQGRIPFFAFVNYMDAHFPYIPPAPFDRKFPGKNAKLLQDDLYQAQEKALHGIPFEPGTLAHLHSQYDGGIAYTDSQIGHLIDWLKKRNLYDNTLIVVTADHGEAFGEKGLVLHGNSVYQNLLHVGLMIKYPKKSQTGVVNDPVSLIDVAPTVLASLGLPADKNMQGRSLLNAQSPSPQTPGARVLFSESFPCPVPHSVECTGYGCTSRAVLTWPYKLLTSSAGKHELYDVSKDPNEEHDLSVTQEALGDTLGASLKAWTKSMPARAKGQLKLDGDAVQRLKSLGYVQ